MVLVRKWGDQLYKSVLKDKQNAIMGYHVQGNTSFMTADTRIERAKRVWKQGQKRWNAKI